MDQEFNSDQDRLSADGTWSRNWEDQYVDEFTIERDSLEEQTKLEQDHLVQKAWHSFQNSATSVTHLYKERLQGNYSWGPFQNAAGSVTEQYKDAVEAQKKSYELGVQVGCHRRIRDIITWAKKRRRHVRREELVAFLCGKAMPVKPNRHSPPRSRGGSRTHSERGSPTGSVYTAEQEAEPDLTAFENALTLQGLDGAMSNVSVGYQGSTGQSRSDDLNCFIMEGLARHNARKRTVPCRDVNMDSPTRKRSRLL